MRVVIATFPEEHDAEMYRRTLRDAFGLKGSAVGVGTIAADGEPYHEDRLVVAWVSEHLADAVRDLAGRCGARLHDAPRAAAVPHSIVEEELANASRTRTRERDQA